jgi:hypothetical protein
MNEHLRELFHLANSAIYPGDRSWRAAKRLAIKLELFVDERISKQLQTTELRGEQHEH